MAKDGSLTEIGFDTDFCEWADGWINEALELTEKNDPRADYIPCTILLKSTGEVIGNVGCTYYEDTDRIGICYFAGADYRRKGYIGEAVKAYIKSTYHRCNLAVLIKSTNIVIVAIAIGNNITCGINLIKMILQSISNQFFRKTSGMRNTFFLAHFYILLLLVLPNSITEPGSEPPLFDQTFSQLKLDDKERIIYIFGLTWDNNGTERAWSDLYTTDEKALFTAKLD